VRCLGFWEGLSLEFAGNLGHSRSGAASGAISLTWRRLTMARVGLLVALSFCGLALAGCGKTGGFSAEASPTAAAVTPLELDAGAKRAAKDAEYRALEFGRTGPPVAWQGRQEPRRGGPGAALSRQRFRLPRLHPDGLYRERTARDARHRLSAAERHLAAGKLSGLHDPCGTPS